MSSQEFALMLRRAGDSDWSSSEQDWLTAWNIITCLLSMAGSGFIVASLIYLSVKSYREDPSRLYLLKLLHFRLVFMLSISDIMYSLAMLAGDPENKSDTCYWQAIWSSFFELTSVGWVLCIAYTLWRTITREGKSSPEEDNKIFKIMWAANWVFAFFWTCIPLADGNHYGDAGAWCWIDDTDTGNAMRYLTFYVWLWVAILLICIMYYSLMTKIHKIIKQGEAVAAARSGQAVTTAGGATNTSSTLEQQQEYVPASCCVVVCDIAKILCSDEGQYDHESAPLVRCMKRLFVYPLILIGCWTFGTINRLQNSFEPDNPNLGLFVMHMITSNLNGLCNSIAYGYNRTFRSDAQRYCCDWVGSKDPSQENSNDVDAVLDDGFTVQTDEASPNEQAIRTSLDKPLQADSAIVQDKKPSGAAHTQV